VRNSRDPKTSGVLLPAKRRELIAERLRTLGSVHVAALEQEFGISSMTARRDLQLLERAGRAERIYGGAVAPGPARREDPFRTRLGQAIEAKERLGLAACELVADGETVFVDGSTTAYLATRSLLAAGRRISVITNSVPVMDLVASSDVPGTTAIGIAGTLRKATRSFVGPDAIEAIGGHFADKLIFSVQGVAGGVLYDADPLEREVKRAMIRQARQKLLLIDGSKLSLPGAHEIAALPAVSIVVVDGASATDVRALEALGITVRAVGP
jgi:DeoR/GlpR family transcriptional regulator of sugar metabolism